MLGMTAKAVSGMTGLSELAEDKTIAETIRAMSAILVELAAIDLATGPELAARRRSCGQLLSQVGAELPGDRA